MSKICMIFEGSSEIQRLVIARAISAVHTSQGSVRRLLDSRS